MNPFRIVIEHHGQRSFMWLEGELDICHTDRLRRAIDQALGRAPTTLVADLSALGFTDCAGLSVLAWAHQSQAGDGHELIITGCRPIVRRLLSLTGYDMYLHVSEVPADIVRLKDVALGRGGLPAPFGLN